MFLSAVEHRKKIQKFVRQSSIADSMAGTYTNQESVLIEDFYLFFVLLLQYFYILHTVSFSNILLKNLQAVKKPFPTHLNMCNNVLTYILKYMG